MEEGLGESCSREKGWTQSSLSILGLRIRAQEHTTPPPFGCGLVSDLLLHAPHFSSEGLTPKCKI